MFTLLERQNQGSELSGMRCKISKEITQIIFCVPTTIPCPSLVPVISPKAPSLLYQGSWEVWDLVCFVTDSCLMIAKSPVPAEILSQQCDLDRDINGIQNCSKYHASCYEAIGNGERYTSEAVTAQMAPILRQTKILELLSLP